MADLAVSRQCAGVAGPQHAPGRRARRLSPSNATANPWAAGTDGGQTCRSPQRSALGSGPQRCPPPTAATRRDPARGAARHCLGRSRRRSSATVLRCRPRRADHYRPCRAGNALGRHPSPVGSTPARGHLAGDPDRRRLAPRITLASRLACPNDDAGDHSSPIGDRHSRQGRDAADHGGRLRRNAAAGRRRDSSLDHRPGQPSLRSGAPLPGRRRAPARYRGGAAWRPDQRGRPTLAADRGREQEWLGRRRLPPRCRVGVIQGLGTGGSIGSAILQLRFRAASGALPILDVDRSAAGLGGPVCRRLGRFITTEPRRPRFRPTRSVLDASGDS